MTPTTKPHIPRISSAGLHYWAHSTDGKMKAREGEHHTEALHPRDSRILGKKELGAPLVWDLGLAPPTSRRVTLGVVSPVWTSVCPLETLPDVPPGPASIPGELGEGGAGRGCRLPSAQAHLSAGPPGRT